jgi:SAM-dependent methyltransferase
MASVHPLTDRQHDGEPDQQSAHGPHDGPEWDQVYTDTPPWDIGRPQPTLQRLASIGAIRGRVIDLGCGTGEHALMCAQLGLDTTGVDISVAAIEAAENKARQRNVTARFVRRDVRELSDLGESFDTVLDCGLYVHLCDDDADRAAYLRSVRSLTHPGSRYFMLCFRGDSGHHRGHTPDEIAVAFADGWQIDSIGETTLDTAPESEAVPAWLVSLTRSAPDTSDASTIPVASASKASSPLRRLRPSRSSLLLGIAALLVVTAHLGLAGAALATSRWTMSAAVLVGAMIAVKIALIVGGRHGWRHIGTGQTGRKAHRQVHSAEHTLMHAMPKLDTAIIHAYPAHYESATGKGHDHGSRAETSR